MHVILAYLRSHFSPDRLLKWGKGGAELAEAVNKARKAAGEARLVARQEARAAVSLGMFRLDRKVMREHGFSVRIIDPEVYVRELKVDRDLVDQVLMERGNDLARFRSTSRWTRNW